MDTKERILQAALALYNSKGISTIASRHIAAGLGISPGNLHYHYKYTDDIIKTLYARLAARFDQLMSQLESIAVIDIDVIAAFSIRSFELAYEYRFIFLHFVEIGWRIPAIQSSYMKLTQRRTHEFLNIFHQLVKNGTFRSDLPDSVWPALAKQIFMVGDFWLSNNELTQKLTEQEAISHYSNVFNLMFLPYLAKT